MKKSVAVSILTILVVSVSRGQAPRPIPPGLRQGEKAEQEAERSIPGPIQPSRAVDPARLRREANELAGLSQSIPLAVDQVGKGLLPKDLDQKLKKIEKLAKHLRSEVSRQTGIP